MAFRDPAVALVECGDVRNTDRAVFWPDEGLWDGINAVASPSHISTGCTRPQYLLKDVQRQTPSNLCIIFAISADIAMTRCKTPV
ncbi:hypothetical protein BFN67_08935 [Pseudaminobacter manganicus]|uniref:Uncharacterized protein n=1 Tax=Manganibacter manganicus TaxID=1873176 RepID=A0A1V8RJM9_9HYPH|nr:hypothetical protein BFN67_08935 [Pseudaminobacter manganicus]